MFINKLGDIVHKFTNDDKLFTILSTIDEFIPGHVGKSLKVGTILVVGVENHQLALAGLKLSLEGVFFGVLLEVISQSEKRQRTDQPFGGIVMIKLDAVAVVRREFVVVVVIPLAESQDGGDP